MAFLRVSLREFSYLRHECHFSGFAYRQNGAKITHDKPFLRASYFLKNHCNNDNSLFSTDQQFTLPEFKPNEAFLI